MISSLRGLASRACPCVAASNARAAWLSSCSEMSGASRRCRSAKSCSNGFGLSEEAPTYCSVSHGMLRSLQVSLELSNCQGGTSEVEDECD